MLDTTKILDFQLKDNLALVDVLSTKESIAVLDAIVNLDRENELQKGLTVPQVGSDYQVVRVVALSDQEFEIEGAENQLIISVGNYYIISANRISYIGGITTTIPQALVNTQDLLIELRLREED